MVTYQGPLVQARYPGTICDSQASSYAVSGSCESVDDCHVAANALCPVLARRRFAFTFSLQWQILQRSPEELRVEGGTVYLRRRNRLEVQGYRSRQAGK